MASMEEEIVDLLDCIEQNSWKVDLILNRYDILSPLNIIKNIQVRLEVIYLGALITNTGRCEKEIKCRLATAKTTLGRLVTIWKDR